MPDCNLQWNSATGFELDLDASDGDVHLRLAAVPVPADGTAELLDGPVELDRLEILFKAQVDVCGEPGQLLDAQVRLESSRKLVFTAKVEDVETAEVIDFRSESPVSLQAGLPVSGGPRPVASTEDDLDWEDENTLEKMLVNAPESAGSPEAPASAPAPAGKGLQALLRALVDVDPDEHAAPDGSTPPVLQLVSSTEEGDQQFSDEDSALGLLRVIVGREGIELEDGYELQDLALGTARILARQLPASDTASAMADWLLEQPAVADLFLGDEDLANLIEQW